MEEKKLDLNTIIGFALIFGLLFWIMYQNQPTAPEASAKPKTEQAPAKALPTTTAAVTTAADSSAYSQKFGVFGNSAALAAQNAKKEVQLDNEVLSLKIALKGGQVTEATLKSYERFKKGSGELVRLIQNNNANFNTKLITSDNKIINTADLYFEPQVLKSGDNQILSLKAKTANGGFIEYRYSLKPKDYLVGFDVVSQGLTGVLAAKQPVELEWNLKTFRNEKSVSYENRYAEIYYQYEDDKTSYVGQGENATENPESVKFVAYKQHFFSSILLTDKPFAKADLVSNNLVKDEEVDTLFTKDFKAKIALKGQAGEINQNMHWYFGPTDYKLLKTYERDLEYIVPLGWGIFGWINRYFFIPAYDILSGFLAQGWAIILFTILIKLVLSPITYKSFLSQAKMKVLRPDIAELNEKFKKDPMKRQQETMKLYSKAGVNPMAGCIPALLQMPIFYALFQFFPAELALRQQGFLWANDLSSFDAVVQLPFYIPLYGNHISLFPILASIAIFFYMKMTTGDQAMQQPQQEGMPDMAKIMKIMIYISPVMMLIFFNNYASGLSLYYFISNLLTIGIMLVIKNYIVDNDKIHAQIQENKQREPKQQSKFQRKLQEMMEAAEAEKAKKKK